MDYQTGAATCPMCGSSDQVQTARELFDTMNGAREQAFQRLSQFQQPGQGQGQGQGQYGDSSDDDDYDHYNVEGSGSERELRAQHCHRARDLASTRRWKIADESAGRYSGRRSGSPGGPSAGG